jgi:Fic family protein
MLRLLQIHPFADGNGRLARAFALSIMLSDLGPDRRFVSVIRKLYANRGMHLHRASLSIRDRDDWVDYLRLGAECVAGARSDH